jgi:hypothetical protein
MGGNQMTIIENSTGKVTKTPNKVVKAVDEFYHLTSFYRFDGSVFLGGSIEMGKAEDWQTRLTKDLENQNLLILNPRRDDWDSSWEQKISNPQFYAQVNWELSALENANVIAFYFDPNTKSPITLMELGLWVQSGKCVVCCPEGFWRKGNVDILCQRYHTPVHPNYETFLINLKNKLNIV